MSFLVRWFPNDAWMRLIPTWKEEILIFQTLVIRLLHEISKKAVLLKKPNRIGSIDSPNWWLIRSTEAEPSRRTWIACLEWWNSFRRKLRTTWFSKYAENTDPTLLKALPDQSFPAFWHPRWTRPSASDGYLLHPASFSASTFSGYSERRPFSHLSNRKRDT